LTGVVVDASVALAWCFPDEASEYADRVLVALDGLAVMVPAIWGLEVANAVLTGERGKRIKPPEIQRFTALLEGLSPAQDFQPVAHHVNQVLPLAREYGLSAYDAAYLELAIRRGVPLAGLDGKLRKAAQKSGVTIFCGKPA
jgi:predicted nucleic acid-binding protein